MITFADIVKILRWLGLYWHRNSWMTHDLDARRSAYIDKIRDINRGRK